jgi:aminobenzoyl-glutamate utilization protein B
LTAIDIFKNPSVTQTALTELNRRRGADFKYDALVGDRKAPLDYRK